VRLLRLLLVVGVLWVTACLKPTAISDSAAESDDARVVSEDNLRQPEVTGEAKSIV
jgi:hypothetical protein